MESLVSVSYFYNRDYELFKNVDRPGRNTMIGKREKILRNSFIALIAFSVLFFLFYVFVGLWLSSREISGIKAQVSDISVPSRTVQQQQMLSTRPWEPSWSSSYQTELSDKEILQYYRTHLTSLHWRYIGEYQPTDWGTQTDMRVVYYKKLSYQLIIELRGHIGRYGTGYLLVVEKPISLWPQR